MSLRSDHIARNAASTIGFPATGAPQKKKETDAPKKRVRAEERAEKALRDDPHGSRGARRNERGGQQTRVVRRRVRRRRVSTPQTQSNYGSTKTQQAQQAKQAKTQAKAQAQGEGPGQTSNQHMMRRMNSQSNLNRMTAQFQSAQFGQPNGPQTPVGKKMAMLGNLQNYMKNDYAAMKANDQDNAFTYRTSEARQLVATLGTMLFSGTKQTKKKDSNGTSGKTLSPAAFGRQKGLLRQLKAMSDPTGPLPEGLPVDYKPFESVA